MPKKKKKEQDLGFFPIEKIIKKFRSEFFLPRVDMVYPNSFYNAKMKKRIFAFLHD
jgi:hypothetical protein